MEILALYWGIMIVFYIIASKNRDKKDKFGFIGPCMMVAVYILVFIMGLRMGINKQITDNLGTIGLQSAFICLVIIAGTIFSIYITRKILKIDRYGDSIDKKSPKQKELSAEMALLEEELEGDTPPTEEEAKKSNKSTLITTLITLSLVAAGMLIGFYIVPSFNMDYDTLDSMTSNWITIGLCIMLVFVGADLGFSGAVAANIKSVGLKVLAFPVAMIVGGLAFGAGAGILAGFGLKDALAITGAFGWYSYAPVVMAGAGSAHAIASAVCFMTNVIRETAGIILIPIAAKKLGYLECLGIAGMADMDVCVPIVERSCRPDTVVYSFVTGFFMCLLTSVMIPALMG